MVLSFDEAGALLDEMAERFPSALLDGLNGGVNLLEEAVPDPEFPPGEMYVLGEYCDDLLGRYINLYYGSFAALAEAEDWDGETWAEELRTTFSHELTHHIESRSGLHALDDRDAAELEIWRRERREEE
nr:metallopeptidase family protein [uncultured Oscillibacter sp.]